MSFLVELKRRNVLRVAAAYLAAAWLVTESTRLIFPIFGVPEQGPYFIVTAFALGLVPALLLSWFYELTPDGIMREKDVVRERSITYVTARRLDIITISLIILALLLVVVDRVWLDEYIVRQAATQAVLPNGTRQSSIEGLEWSANSIAVLPFVNMSDDPGNEYFSDGISEELLNLLAKVPELKVISRSSAFYYKGAQKRLDEIAQELKVAHILEGSVRKSGDQVRITAQLIDARTDTHLWSEVFERKLEDIFAIQDEIAGAVTESLKVTLLGDSPHARPVDPTAYSLFLQAEYLKAQGTAESLSEAIGLYQEALTLAPEYARAWRGIAVCYTNQANRGLRPRDESYTLAKQAIDAALAIDPEFAMAHATLGMFAMAYEGDLAAAAPHLQFALSLEPRNVVLLSYASSLLLRLGRLEEAVAIREYDVSHDPLDPIGYNNLAWAYFLVGQLDAAAATANNLILLAPNYGGAHETLGKVLLLKGEHAAALEALLDEPSEVWRLFGLSLAYHALGRPEESDAALAELSSTYGQDRAYHIAQVHAYRGDVDSAFNWLERAVQDNATSLTYLAVEPMFFNIHADDRWMPLLRRTGMAPEQLARIEFSVEIPGLARRPSK